MLKKKQQIFASNITLGWEKKSMLGACCKHQEIVSRKNIKGIKVNSVYIIINKGSKAASTLTYVTK